LKSSPDGAQFAISHYANAPEPRLGCYLTALLIVFGSSLGFCLLITPLARALAARFGPVDYPDGRRKVHGKATPMAGGVAVLFSLLGTLIVSLWLPGPVNSWFQQEALFLPGLLLASLVIVAVGLVDDFRGLRCRHKLLGQLLAVGIVIGSNLAIDRVRLFDRQLELGLMALPFTVFWLLGTINSFNLLDGMDGLLSSVGLILSLALAAVATLGGQWAPACVAAALAGALLGFLRYNFPPATIFLGDSGSMLIGLVVGALSLRASRGEPATLALVAPLTMLTIPIFDTLAAIVRRKLTGRTIHSTDRAHLHHCLLARGFATRRALLWISVSCLCTALGALASVLLGNELFALVPALGVVGFYLLTRLFGFTELMLVKSYLETGMLSLFRVPPNGQAHQTEIQLQGSANWKLLWSKLTACARELNLTMIRLDVNAPAVYEGYHGHWQCPRLDCENAAQWRAEIPLTVRGQPTGRLEAVGSRGPEPVWAQIAALVQFVESLEAVVATLSDKADRNGCTANGSPADGDKIPGFEGWRIPATELVTNGTVGKPT
jgi:UDP-GlcNAc:undecaprenyl-phosphate/decaprenyl-phosphate GlcNAc-1-phosphate transferase